MTRAHAWGEQDRKIYGLVKYARALSAYTLYVLAFAFFSFGLFCFDVARSAAVSEARSVDQQGSLRGASDEDVDFSRGTRLCLGRVNFAIARCLFWGLIRQLPYWRYSRVAMRSGLLTGSRLPLRT